MKNAMANPRKFSEKIALIKQKEAEGDAAFQQIISEVSAVTKDPATSVPFRKHLPQLYASYKAGSLPDINQSAAGQHQQQNPGSIDLKGVIDEFNILNNRETASPRQQPRRQNLHGYAPVAPRSARCRTVEPHVPYHPPYLSPPPLPGPEWRRFKSDSDIHERLKQQPPAAAQQQQQQAAAQQQTQQHSPGDPGVMGSGNGAVMSPLMHRRVLEVGSSSLMPGEHMKALAGRPKSCGEYPVVLNNNLPYPSSDLLMNGGHHHHHHHHHQQQQPLMVGGTGGGGAGGGGGMGSVAGSQMPGSPSAGSSGCGGPSTPPALNNNYGSLPDLTNIQLSPSPSAAGAQANDFGSGGGMGGRYVNTSMPPPDSPSQLRHNPFAGSPTHKQSMPMNLSLPYSFPSAAAGAASSAAAVSPPGGSVGKQFINETIRKRISDKRLAQASMNHFRNSQSEACSSPVSPHTPPVCSPDGGSGSAGSSPTPLDFFPHMFYAMQQQQPTLHHHQLPSPHSPLPQVQSPPLPHASLQPGQVPSALPLQSMQHQLRQRAPPQAASSAHLLSFDPFKMDTQQQQQRHPSAGHPGGFAVVGATSGGSGGQYAGTSGMAVCMPSMYGEVGLSYSSASSDQLGSGTLSAGGMVMGHMLVGDAGLSGLRHAGAMHKRIPNIILTGADESMRHDCFKDVSCPVFQESFDSGDLFPMDEQLKAELAPLDFEGLQMLDDPSSLVTDPNTEDQLRLG